MKQINEQELDLEFIHQVNDDEDMDKQIQQ